MSIILIDSYSEDKCDANSVCYSANSPNGQSTTGNGLPLAMVKFYLSKKGTITGTCYAKLYAHTGTFGSSTGKGTGDALAISEGVNVSTLTESNTLVNFYFTGSNAIELINGTHYVIAVSFNGGDLDNCIQIGVDSSSPSHNGANTYFQTTTWYTNIGFDVCFYLYASTVTPIVGNKYAIPPFKKA